MVSRHLLLRPFEPTAADPFDSVKAAHLLNRAGFGGTVDEIQRAVQDGPRATVDRLLAFPDLPAEEQGKDVPDLSSLVDYPADFRAMRQVLASKTPDEQRQYRQKLMAANRDAVQIISQWWLARMGRGPYPLQEKLALFWHGHFTTSAREERSALLMWQQNELLRRMAAGNFADFVRAVARDPAMLDYLNNQQNRKQRPNENFARELMELFTLGIGNYSETDIKEAARAFTGWGHDGDDFIFRRNDHDFGVKRFMGRVGNLDGEDIISIILEHPACARYIAVKLFRFFAHDEPDAALSDALGGLLRESRYNLRPLLRTILMSRAFYSPQAIGAQIKSPIQLVVGTSRLLGVPLPTDRRLTNALTQMGQVPLMPPNVQGWPGGRTWINTATLLARSNTLLWLSGGDAPGSAPARPLPARTAAPPYVAAVKASGPAELVDGWLARLIQRPVDSRKRQVLIDSTGPNVDNPIVVRRLVQLILSMPEYQLC